MKLGTLKWTAILCFVVAMTVLLGGGIAIKKELPPYSGKVVDPDGEVLFQKSYILAGQDVYQRYGLMDHGAVWGHGSQRGPEFSATTLHIMAVGIGEHYAQKDYGKPYEKLGDLPKAMIDVKPRHEIKPNRYDAVRGLAARILSHHDLSTTKINGNLRMESRCGKDLELNCRKSLLKTL